MGAGSLQLVPVCGMLRAAARAGKWQCVTPMFVFGMCCKQERMIIKKRLAARLHFDWDPSHIRWHTAVALCAIVLFVHKHSGCLVWLRDAFISTRTHTLGPEMPLRWRHTKQDATHGGALFLGRHTSRNNKLGKCRQFNGKNFFLFNLGSLAKVFFYFIDSGAR